MRLRSAVPARAHGALSGREGRVHRDPNVAADRRSARLLELRRLATIDVLRLLWAGGDDGVSFAGEFFTFDNLCSFPKPYGVTHLPIHIGGSSRAAARRAGRRGDGYFPGGALSPHERALQMDLARSTAVDVGRDPRPGTPPTPQRSSTGAPNALVAAGRIGEDTAAALKAEARRCITAGQYFGHIAYASLVARLLN